MDRIAERIGEAVREYNAELTMRMWVALGMGTLVTLGVFGFLYMITWLMMRRFAGSDLAPLAALGITLVFLVFSIVSALRNEDVLRGLKPLSDTQLAVIAASQAMGGVFITSPRHAVAGFASILTHGPVCVFEGFACKRARLPKDSPSLRACAGVLVRMDHPLAVEEIQPPIAGVQLHRLLLIKTGPIGSDGTAPFVRSIKGEELLRSV